MRNYLEQSDDIKYFRYLIYVVVVYAFIFVLHDTIRSWGFGYGLEDLGIFRQVIWNTGNGDWFQTSIKYPFLANGNWLGFHFSILPIILALPFYKLFPFIETLLIIHVLLVTGTAIIIYKICRVLQLTNQVALFWSTIYLIQPATIYHAMFSFEETSVTVPLITLAIYFTICQRLNFLLVTSLLLLITKENHGATVFGLGLLWQRYNKSWKPTIILCLLGIFGGTLIMLIIIPYFSPFHEHFMFSQQSHQLDYQRYQWLALPFDQLIKFGPQIIFSKVNIVLIFVSFGLFLFMPLGALAFLLPALGEFLVIDLSNLSLSKSVNLYYLAAFVPPLVISSAYAIKNISTKYSHLAKYIMTLILLANLLVLTQPLFLVSSKLIFISKNKMDWSINSNFEQIVQEIPADGTLITDQETGSLISNRRIILPFNEITQAQANYILLRLSLFDFSPATSMQNGFFIEIANKLAKSSDWTVKSWKYPYVLFYRGKQQITEDNLENFRQNLYLTTKYYRSLY